MKNSYKNLNSKFHKFKSLDYQTFKYSQWAASTLQLINSKKLWFQKALKFKKIVDQKFKYSKIKNS